MNLTKITLIASATLVIAACTASKKSTTSTASTNVAPAVADTKTVAAAPTATASSYNFSMIKSADGIYEPGTGELTALQAKYPQLKDASLEKLKQGYEIYTKGACIKCHGAINIYQRDELQWVRIINDMALRARISDAEKDAVFNYVIAIKSTQTK